MTEELAQLFQRDLENLKKEVSAFNNTEDLWKTHGTITNPAGNLALHICGNLLHFFGGVVLKNGYIRERDKEFNDKQVPASTLLNQIDQTIEVVTNALNGFENSKLDDDYPLEFRGEKISNAKFFMHLYGHMSYHLGQINYIRRCRRGNPM